MNRGWSMKWLCLLLVIGLLAGCGKANEGASPTHSSSPSAQASETPSGDTVAKEEGLTGSLEIAAFVAGDANEQWWVEMIEDFKKANPKLEVKSILSGVIGDEIRTRWVTNNPPDVTLLGGESSTKDIQQLTNDRKFEKLDDWLKTAKSYEDPNKLLVDVFSVENRSYDPDGSVIGLPNATGAYGLFYDAKLARENGWTDLPKNWEEFVAFLDKIQNSGTGIAPINYPGKNALGYLTNYIFYDVAQRNPDAYLNGVNIEPGAWTDPAYQEAFNKMATLRKYELAGSLAATHVEAQIAFLQRKAFFYPCGTWLEGEMSKDVPDDFEMQVIPFPINEKGSKSITQTYAGTDLYIPVDAKNKDNAKEFIRFMYQTKYAKSFAEAGLGNFAMKADLEGASTSSSVISFSKMMMDPNLVSFQTKMGRNPTVYVDLNNVFFESLGKAWAGKITAEQLFTGFEQEARKYEQQEGFQKVEDAFLVRPAS